MGIIEIVLFKLFIEIFLDNVLKLLVDGSKEKILIFFLC